MKNYWKFYEEDFVFQSLNVFLKFNNKILNNKFYSFL